MILRAYQFSTPKLVDFLTPRKLPDAHIQIRPTQARLQLSPPTTATKMAFPPAVVLGLRGVQVLLSVIVLGLTAYSMFHHSLNSGHLH
jgi:hypothetical protein